MVQEQGTARLAAAPDPRWVDLYRLGSIFSLLELGVIVFSILSNASGLISSVLMLRSPFFGKVTAYSGFVLSIFGVLIIFPALGPALGLVATIASPVWLALLARDFSRMARGAQSASKA